MSGTLSAEREVNVPASQAWGLYGGLNLAKFSTENFPHVFDKVEVLEGDGGVGTVLLAVFPPGTPGFSSYKEKYTKMDNEKLLKESEIIEGGYLDLGFTLFRVRLEIIEKSEESCIVRFTIEYEVKEEAADNSSLVSMDLMVMIMEAANIHLLKNKQT